MSSSTIRTAVTAAIVTALFLVAGCSERPSAAAYAAFETEQRTEGKLRTETAPADVPYDASDLVRNFERIALHREADFTKSGGNRNWTANPLQRWDGPLRYRLFGSGVTQADRAEVAKLMHRVGELTGLKISESRTDPNFWILISTPDERDDISSDLAQGNSWLANDFELWRNNRYVHCLGDNRFSGDDRNRFSDGLVVIGSEVGGVMRRACLHEEIVQIIGLANDHPEVRPSIFNDDGEFALLTKHDEHLLRILYDPRLEPGMTAEEAMPIVRRIVDGIALDRPPATQVAPSS